MVAAALVDAVHVAAAKSIGVGATGAGKKVAEYMPRGFNTNDN